MELKQKGGQKRTAAVKKKRVYTSIIYTTTVEGLSVIIHQYMFLLVYSRLKKISNTLSGYLVMLSFEVKVFK